MQYFLHKWLHEEIEKPIDFYVELDDIGWEQRRIEKFIDGSHIKHIGLQESAWPSMEEMNNSPEDFEAHWIEAEQFEALWASLSDAECHDYRSLPGYTPPQTHNT